jgi:DNA-binding NarL/FixJ family response regulator
VISDIVRPGMDGLTFLRAFKKAHPGTPVMIVSGALSPALRQRAYRLGASACYMKPIRASRLLKAVARALRGPSANG